MADYDIECVMLAEHFLQEDRPDGMSEEEFDGHADRLAQEIQRVVEQFCEHDDEWTKGVAAASAGQPSD